MAVKETDLPIRLVRHYIRMSSSINVAGAIPYIEARHGTVVLNKPRFFKTIPCHALNVKADAHRSEPVRWSRKIGQLVKVYSTGYGGIRDDEAPEVYA